MKKVYWIATYKEIKDIKKLKQYSEKVTPIFKNFGATPVVRGGEYKALEGDNFIKTRRFYSKLHYNKEAIIGDFWSEGDHKVIYLKKLNS